MSQWIGILIAVAVVAAIIYWLRSAGGTSASLEKELYRLCRGDKDMMERLIAHEQSKRQDRTRQAAMRAAIDALKRDNR